MNVQFRGEERRGLSDRGEPARKPDRYRFVAKAVKQPDCQHRRPRDGWREARGLWTLRDPITETLCSEGSGHSIRSAFLALTCCLAPR